MTYYVDNDFGNVFGVDERALLEKLTNEVLSLENCPYEVEISLTITDNDGIHEINLEARGIDAPTDVLSFPNVDYDEPGNFEVCEANEIDCFNPETGELLLGDIIINKDRVFSQAEEFGHSVERELAFLITHSLYHLCGYDHIDTEDAKIMEEKQKECLNNLGITRDESTKES